MAGRVHRVLPSPTMTAAEMKQAQSQAAPTGAAGYAETDIHSHGMDGMETPSLRDAMVTRRLQQKSSLILADELRQLTHTYSLHVTVHAARGLGVKESVSIRALLAVGQFLYTELFAICCCVFVKFERERCQII